MKFSILAVLAIATGALAAPGGPQPPQPPKAPKAPKAPVKQFNNCGNDQSLYCCATNAQDSSVSCVSFTNGGIGGVCNGIQMCCNNNGSGSQSCGLNTGGGTITFSLGGPGGPRPLE
ncbi:hypothetical protein KAF25_002535 [Fusarium avenaceum]|uniref:Hydrophobin 1 n=1 Tax=Fusarium avenaceum TaxID=40199 RepID=A0A9P7H9J8_9HYPO|nr:hypothetical protein KAF25_002535 [Fusarium avenaceum]